MKNIIVILAVLSSCVLADESLDAQIEALQHLSPQERVQSMNKIKLQIAKMNDDERVKAIQSLQSSQNGVRKNYQFKQNSSIGNMQQYRINQNSAPTMQHMQGR